MNWSKTFTTVLQVLILWGVTEDGEGRFMVNPKKCDAWYGKGVPGDGPPTMTRRSIPYAASRSYRWCRPPHTGNATSLLVAAVSWGFWRAKGVSPARP